MNDAQTDTRTPDTPSATLNVKNVAFFSMTWETGGVLTVTLNLARYFHRQGIKVYLYCEKVIGEPFTPEQRGFFTLRQFSRDASHSPEDATGEWQKLLNQDQIDVLISQGFPALPYEAIKRGTRTKTVFCLHGIPFWEENLYISRRELALRDAPLHKCLKWRLIDKPAFRLTSHLRHNSADALSKSLPFIDKVVCLIPAYADDFYRGLLRTGKATEDDKDKFSAIVNPLLPDAEPVDLAAKEKLVIYSGRLCKEDKRVERLLQAWARIERQVPDWRLEIIGGGVDEQELREEATLLGLRNVSFEGFHHDVSPFYRRASVSCLVSQYEGLGMALTEAQRYGAVPMGFRMKSLDYIIEGGAGIAVRPYSIRQYSRKLLSIIKDSCRRQTMMQNALRNSRRYGLELIGRQWLDLFSQLV